MAEEQDYATVSGTKVHRSDFAYAPPGTGPSEWKLPIHDASHVRNALARWNQTDLPADAKAAAWRKIVAAAKKFGIEVSDKESELSLVTGPLSVAKDEGRRTTDVVNLVSRSLRLELADPVGTFERAGVMQPLYEHSICVTGEWVKGGKKFAITNEDLRAMVANFEKRKNEQVVVDYEHASEQPEVARGGPVPAAGWIHNLSFVTGPSSIAGDRGQGARDNGHFLSASIEWTPQALELIRSGQYRFFSPAIDFHADDKETGEPQGATLTSGALTNHPFLEELPAITLSDGDSTFQLFNSSTHDGSRKVEELNESKGATMKKFTLKKLEGGEHDGHVGVFDGDECAGHVDKDHFTGFAKKFCKFEGAEQESGVRSQESEAGGKALCVELKLGTEDLTAALPEIKRLVELGRETERDRARTASRTVLLGECVRAADDGGPRSDRGELRPPLQSGILDGEKAKVLLRSGKISAEDWIDAHETAEFIERAVQEGRVLPKDKVAAFKIALSSAEYREFLKTAPRVVLLGSVGLGTGTAIPVDDEVSMKVKEAQRANDKLTFSEAFTQVLASDRALAERYHTAHRREVGSGGATQ